MKIVIASGIYPPDIGGPATYSELIAREFNERGIKVAVICYGDVGRPTSYIAQFPVKRILRKHNKLIRYFLYFWSLLKLAKDTDIIYAQGPLAAGLPAMVVSRILRKRFIIKIVGDYAWEQFQNKKLKIKNLAKANTGKKFVDIEKFQNKKYDFWTELRRKIQKFVCKKADKVIVPSEFLKKIVKGWGVDGRKVEVIYNAILTEEDLQNYGTFCSSKEDIIISAGRPEPWKGFKALKQIMPELKKENPKFKLIIATKMSHDKLMRYFRASKIFVLNSGYEGFSHIILEAMACGLPVITTNVCGNPEIVQDGYNGLLVEYNNKEQLKNAILKLWKNKALQQKFIKNGRKTLEKFKLEKMINKTLEVLMPRHSTGSASGGKLLMITGDRALAQGKRGPFYYMLEEFSKYWDRIDIICPRIKQKIFKVYKNVYIHSGDSPLIFHPFFILKKGAEIYKKEKFDLFTVHSYPPFYNDIGGRWLYNKIKVPYILEIMHITGYPRAGDFKEWFYKILEKLFVKFFAKEAKAVRVVNKKQTPEFLKKTGAPEEKLKYIPAFYIDFDVFKPQSIEKKYDVVFSGRLVKNKGINLLLKALENIKSQIPNFRLIIIGSGPLEKEIKKFIKKNRLENNIIFAGWLPTIEDVAKIYNQSKIFIMPSFNEGGPRVCLEAMACKVPVITSRVGVMLDIIKDPSSSSGQANGLFIDWNIDDIAKKIKLLLKDKDLYKKIAENGYQTVQQFERKKAIKNYAQTYKNLLYSA